MKHAISIVFLIFSGILNMQLLYSQSISSPESITLDPATGDYYISCPGNHTIIRRDPAGNFSLFQPSSAWCSSPKGLCISGNVLYATDLTYIRGYSLDSGLLVMNLQVPGASFLNDITVDPQGDYLYTTDNQSSKIFRIEIATQTPSAWLSTGLAGPNGIYYDGPSNRLLVVEFSIYGTIKSINLSTQAIATLVANTPGQLDGISRDNLGYWYVSSWATNKVYRYHPSLVGSPLEVSIPGTVNGPADIFVNTFANPNVLAVPSMSNNQLFFIPLSWAGTPDASPEPGFKLYPRPARDKVILEWIALEKQDIRLNVSNLQGKVVATFHEACSLPGLNRVEKDISGLRPGYYSVQILVGSTAYHMPLLKN